VPREILRVFNTILYENEFQNPELFPTQVSLSPEQSTLVGNLNSDSFSAKPSKSAMMLYFKGYF
jgi:hypothetical protein